VRHDIVSLQPTPSSLPPHPTWHTPWPCPQVRVQALMNGQVVIRPILDDAKAAQAKDDTPKWVPAYRRSESPKPNGRRSIRASPAGSVNGDTMSSRDGSPSRVQREGNGMVLYSMHDDEDGSTQTRSASPGRGDESGTPVRRGRLVTRRAQGAGGSDRSGRTPSSRRCAMVDRASSPIVIDPATSTPLNVPAQEQFWGRSTVKPGAGSPSSKAHGVNGPSMIGSGALTQAPPPPPVSRLGQASQGAKAQAAATPTAITAPPAVPSESRAATKAQQAPAATAAMATESAPPPAQAGLPGDDDLVQLGESPVDPADAHEPVQPLEPAVEEPSPAAQPEAEAEALQEQPSPAGEAADAPQEETDAAVTE
jgi:hypothetical protein